MSVATPFVPDPSDAELAESALRDLQHALASEGPVHLRFAEGGDVVVPRSALTALGEILSTFAQGEGVTVLPTQSELTTQQAADAMRVSRPYLIGLLESGKIAFRTVGSHRRVQASSLVSYMRADEAERRAAADALSAETRELGLTRVRAAMSAPLVLDAAAVAAACSPADAVAALRAALAGGLDPAADLPRQGVPLGAGELLLMPSDGGGLRHAGIKLATVAPGNAALGLPRIQGSYVLFDAATLGVVAVLDGIALTTLRTPAVSVAAVLDRLREAAGPAGTGPLRVAVIGSGPQAHGHVATLVDALAGQPVAVTQLVRDPARTAATEGAQIAGARLIRLGGPGSDDALRGADVVLCATSAREPLFDAALVADHAVVIAVGSHEPDARELPAGLLARATVVVEDRGAALREAGDVVLAIADGALTAGDLVPMRDVVTGAVRPDPARPLVFKSTGMSWEDLVVAEAVLAGSR